MKRLAILLMALGIISNSVVIVAAEDNNVEKIEMTAAEIGAVEDISHPFLFGESGSWELTVDAFQAENGEEMQFTSGELGELIEAGALRCSVEMDDSKWRLSTSPNVVVEDDTAMFRIRAKHSYGVTSQEMVLRICLRVDKSIYWNEVDRIYTLSHYITGIAGRENTLVLQKGTVLESNDMLYSAHYNPLSQLGPQIRITQEDVKQGNVLANGEELYMATKRDRMLTFVLDQNISYSTQISAAQKPVNLYYSVDEIASVSVLYPDIDFTCVTFSGEPSFINSGELVFEAIGDEETVVYTYEGKRLEPVASVYDDTNDTVTVRGIKRLGAYVVASESIQDIEEEENRISPVEPHYQIKLLNQSNPDVG